MANRAQQQTAPQTTIAPAASGNVIQRRKEPAKRSFGRDADAYLNVKLKAADGSEISIPVTIPLTENTKLGRSLIAAAEAYAAANNGEQRVFELVGTVRMAEPEDSTYSL